MPVLAVTLDSREPPDLLQTLGTIGGVATSVAALPAGDCMIVATDAVLIIERKAPNDLLSSIMDGRLFNQVAGMRAMTPWCYVLITGPILPDRDGHCWVDRRQTNFSWNSLQGALQTAQELGAIVVWANGPDDYLPCLNRIIARPRTDVRLGAIRAASIVPAGEAILTSLPGIGPEHARAVLEYTGTAALGFSYLTGEYPIDKVPGIGPETRRKVRAALGLNEREYLHVMVTESANAALESGTEGQAAA